MARLEDFSRNTHPLVNDLKGPADDLGPDACATSATSRPTSRTCSATWTRRFRSAARPMPALEKTLTEASPLVDALHTFFPELNPILSFFNFHQTTIAAFITNGGADLAADYGTGQRGQTQIGTSSRTARSRRTSTARPAGLGARQRLPAPELAHARAEARHGRELQVPGRRAEVPGGRAEGGPEGGRQARAVLRAAAVALQRPDLPVPEAGRGAAAREPEGLRGQPARPRTRIPARTTSALPLRARLPAAWGRATSFSTSRSSSSRRSSSAWRRSGCSRSTRTTTRPEFWAIVAFAEACVLRRHRVHDVERGEAGAPDRRVDGGPGRRDARRGAPRSRCRATSRSRSAGSRSS